jgi:hypothetical protein
MNKSDSVLEMCEDLSDRPPIPDGDWSHVVVVVEGENNIIRHMCWYESEPSEDTIAHLKEELITDPEFDMAETIDKCTYQVFTREEFDSLEFTQIKEE